MSVRRLAAALVLAAFGIAALPAAIAQAVAWIRDGAARASEDPLASRRRALGALYAAGIERIESVVPAGADYVAVDADPQQRNQLSWVRFDLAPRKGIYWGKLRGFRRFPHPLAAGAALPEHTVIAYGAERAPEVVPTAELLAGTAVPRGRRDEGILCAIEAPAEGARLSGPVVLEGWCLESPGRPCAAVRVVLDGREAGTARLERPARPDLAARFPQLGDVSRAGFRATLALPGDHAGEHDASVIFETSDGRFRDLGPRVFRWTP